MCISFVNSFVNNTVDNNQPVCFSEVHEFFNAPCIDNIKKNYLTKIGVKTASTALYISLDTPASRVFTC